MWQTKINQGHACRRWRDQYRATTSRAKNPGGRAPRKHEGKTPVTRTISGNNGAITLASGNNPVSISGTISASVAGNSSTGRNGNVLYGPSSASSVWTITNSGLVQNTNITESTAIALGQRGLPNSSTGYNNPGSYVTGTIINNSGAKIVGAEDAINIWGVGSVTNMSGGTITAGNGGSAIGFYGAKGTVDNLGVVLASGSTGIGVDAYDGANVTNAAGATISGGNIGVYLGGYYTAPGVQGHNSVFPTSTVNNFGVIIGSGGNGAAMAVEFDGATYQASDRVIVHPGASFSGTVGVGTGVLELGSGSSTGTLTGIGSQYTNVSTLQFDSGTDWVVKAGSSASGLAGVTITGLNKDATIDLTGFVATNASFASNKLTLTNSGNQHITLNVTGNFNSTEFHVATYAGTGTVLTNTLCFAAGTGIATPAGNVPVEDLTVGAEVLTHFAGPEPVRWIGRRSVDCARHPRPREVWPVRVAAGAFGPSRPVRDLLLSPNHGVYIDGALIPVRLLINGTSIEQLPMDQVVYFHIELDEHDLLLAEGILAESYLDAGDRANFLDGAETERLHPDFASRADGTAALWETAGCAPLVLHGARLDAARRMVRPGRSDDGIMDPARLVA